MGTNYYLYQRVCEVCGRGDEPLHIGKSSAGWCFALHVTPEMGINNLKDWERLWSNTHSIIKDEYGEIIPSDHMAEIIRKRKGYGREPMDHRWLRENNAIIGPHNLARCKVDGIHCIGHGQGTWDLIVGEFF